MQEGVARGSVLRHSGCMDFESVSKSVSTQFAVVMAAPIPFLISLAFLAVVIWRVCRLYYDGRITSFEARLGLKADEVANLTQSVAALKVELTARPQLSSNETSPSKFTKLVTIKNKFFSNETVELTGKKFIECTFTNVRIKYSGGEYELINNTFNNKPILEPGSEEIADFIKLANSFGIINGVLTPNGVFGPGEGIKSHP